MQLTYWFFSFLFFFFFSRVRSITLLGGVVVISGKRNYGHLIKASRRRRLLPPFSFPSTVPFTPSPTPKSRPQSPPPKFQHFFSANDISRHDVFVFLLSNYASAVISFPVFFTVSCFHSFFDFSLFFFLFFLYFSQVGTEWSERVMRHWHRI